MSQEIAGGSIVIKKVLPRNEIVKKVVSTFIKQEYTKKGKGVTFRYPVEALPGNKSLFIVRPGHKKNFDFRVEVTEEMGLEEGKHNQIAFDLRKKKRHALKKFEDFIPALEELFQCTTNDVEHLVVKYHLKKTFNIGADIEILLKVIKWLFIMEDIIYWDVEGRAFLYNFLIYVINENDKVRLEQAIVKIKDPNRLKSFMKKANIAWTPYRD